MLKLRRIVGSLFLIGFSAGILSPAFAGVCASLKSAPSCCCEHKIVKSACCPMEKSSECPILKKQEASPAGILPGKIVLSFVSIAVPMNTVLSVPALRSHQLEVQHNLSPPTASLTASLRLRSPPSLA